MSDRRLIEQAIKRRVGISTSRANLLTEGFLKADNLHWTCPDCKTTLRGTLTEIQQGCMKCLIQ